MPLSRQTPTGGGGLRNFKPLKVDYSVNAIIQLIDMYGSRWDWYSCLVCPCTVQVQQEQHRFQTITCGLCNGTGWTYLLNREIRGVPNANRRYEETPRYRAAEVGNIHTLRVGLSVKPVDKVNIRDKLIFKESITLRSEAKKYVAGLDEYKFSYPIVELGKVLDENGIEYDSTNLLESERDCTVNETGNLLWLNRNKPAAGVAFSIYYGFYPTYIVMNAAHEIRGFMAGGVKETDIQSFEDMPRYLDLKLEILDRYLFQES